MAGLSALQRATRAFVCILFELARVYGLDLSVTRDSDAAAINAAFRKVVRKAHPDKGGNHKHVQRLNAARDVWEDARRTSTSKAQARSGGKSHAAPKASGGKTQAEPKADAARPNTAIDVAVRPGFRIHASAVLLTYQGWGCL